MRRIMIAGNWKMNGSPASVAALIDGLLNGPALAANVDLVVFPSHVFLEQVSTSLKKTSIKWGAQNVCNHSEGAYTGEISASMLKDFHCHYVLVGHSERRHVFGENNTVVSEKFAQTQSCGMIPVLCVGETQEQYQQNQTQLVIEQQLQAILNLPGGVNLLRNAVIAYEPVWAIGTGLTATPEQAQAVHANIRRKIAKDNSEIAQNLCILYGGSVKSNNAKALLGQSDIDGLLVGGASLHPDEFIKIATSYS